MEISNKISISTLILSLAICTRADANVTELIAGLETERFIDGVNLSDNYPSAALAAEWSSDRGVFTSLSCFISEPSVRKSIHRGCDIGAGVFLPLNEKQALTFELGHHDYSSETLRGWDYSDISLSWHVNRNHLLKVSTSNSLLGQGVSATSLSYHATKSLSEKWHADLGLSISSLNSSPSGVDGLEHLTFGVQRVQGRWTSELRLLFKSSDYQRFVKIDQSDPEIAFNIRYRLY